MKAFILLLISVLMIKNYLATDRCADRPDPWSSCRNAGAGRFSCYHCFANGPHPQVIGGNPPVNSGSGRKRYATDLRCNKGANPDGNYVYLGMGDEPYPYYEQLYRANWVDVFTIPQLGLENGPGNPCNQNAVSFFGVCAYQIDCDNSKPLSHGISLRYRAKNIHEKPRFVKDMEAKKAYEKKKSTKSTKKKKLFSKKKTGIKNANLDYINSLDDGFNARKEYNDALVGLYYDEEVEEAREEMAQRLLNMEMEQVVKLRKKAERSEGDH